MKELIMQTRNKVTSRKVRKKKRNKLKSAWNSLDSNQKMDDQYCF